MIKSMVLNDTSNWHNANGLNYLLIVCLIITHSPNIRILEKTDNTFTQSHLSFKCEFESVILVFVYTEKSVYFMRKQNIKLNIYLIKSNYLSKLNIKSMKGNRKVRNKYFFLIFQFISWCILSSQCAFSILSDERPIK